MDRIKESFDSLPIAVCFFDKNGVVRLINHRMLAVASQLRKGGIQTLAELHDALRSPPPTVRCLDPQLYIFRFSDGTELRFAEESIKTAAGLTYTQVTAADVTELMWRQKHLQEESAKLAEANERMRRLFEQMPEIIRQEETLAMKLRVHDDIGHSILAVRRALIRRAGLEELRASAALWEQSIAVLYRSNRITASPEPMKVAVRRAAEMGVRVLTEGKPPESRSFCETVSLAIRECAANCARTLSADVRPHRSFSYQQRRCTEGENHGGRRPIHAASPCGRDRRQNGDTELAPLLAYAQSAGKGGNSA